jgi:hypothetical protein
MKVAQSEYLTQKQKEYLGASAENASEIVARCLDLLREQNQIAEATWTDPTLTSTSEKYCLAVTVNDGFYYGHGQTKKSAAIECFSHLWFEFVTVPSAPPPSEDELLLIGSGQSIAAIKSYIERTGQTLRIARFRLNL